MPFSLLVSILIFCVAGKGKSLVVSFSVARTFLFVPGLQNFFRYIYRFYCLFSRSEPLSPSVVIVYRDCSKQNTGVCEVLFCLL